MSIGAVLPKDIQELEVIRDFGEPEELIDYLMSQRGLNEPSIYRYISYMKKMTELAHAIAEVYDMISPLGMFGKKEHFRHVGPLELVYMANYLYILDSYDVSGSVLECGTSHGYSTCVLSQACHMLGRTLYAADSFCGLPSVRDDEPFFREGDYAASLNIVQRNMENLGEPSAVSFVKGFYSDSLPEFNEEICLLWLDVDLFESATDVMSNVVGQFNKSGVVFSHEFTDFHNKIEPRSAKRPPNAVYDVLEQNNIEYKSKHLLKYFGAIGFANSVQWESLDMLPLLYERLCKLDQRWRIYDELRDSNTVRFAFNMKKRLLGWREKRND